MVFFDCFKSTTVNSPNKRNTNEFDEKCESPGKRFKFEWEVEQMENLPNEILLNIFDYLDSSSLLSACLVNKNWMNLITHTKRTMQKIGSLVIDNTKINEEEFPKLTRKYQSIHFEEITEWNIELMSQLECIGDYIQEVIFTECIFNDEEIHCLLKCFPNLKYMDIMNCYKGIAPPTEINHEKVELNHLITLVIRGSSWMLSKISTPHLKRLEVEMIMLYDQEMLIAFLNDQTELKVLHLVNISDLFDSRYGIVNVQFRLKEIVLINLPFADSAQTIRFLKRMKESVEIVDIGIEVSSNISKYVLLNFKRIRHMKIDYECLPTLNSFYHEMDDNRNLKYLALYGNVKSSKQLTKFIQKHPAIEDLIMNGLHGLHSEKFNFWRDFSTNLPNLKILAMRRLNVYNMTFIKLKNLKHLSVEYFGYSTENIMSDFCRNNPNIETFHIYAKYLVYFNGIKNVIENNLPRLKELFISN